jgi:hypothetical protein
MDANHHQIIKLNATSGKRLSSVEALFHLDDFHCWSVTMETQVNNNNNMVQLNLRSERHGYAGASPRTLSIPSGSVTSADEAMATFLEVARDHARRRAPMDFEGFIKNHIVPYSSSSLNMPPVEDFVQEFVSDEGDLVFVPSEVLPIITY